MRREKYVTARSEIVELCTFYVGDRQFGIDILKVQEINKNPTITSVPQAQDYILGVMNLRGRIVTVIDLAKKLGLPFSVPGRDSRTIIVNSQEEYIGLSVDRIGDVVAVHTEKVEPPPVNIGGILGRFTEGVLKTPAGLIGILAVEAVLG
ncbi:MAG: chemotaxis protein CheW [Desulfococcaceae bacterium]|jgi:purine-binding chemotaxis protein CheW|nr:chemotaxis protein CheW [Desulfococcaceae bacterium]